MPTGYDCSTNSVDHDRLQEQIGALTDRVSKLEQVFLGETHGGSELSAEDLRVEDQLNDSLDVRENNDVSGPQWRRRALAAERTIKKQERQIARLEKAAQVWSKMSTDLGGSDQEDL